MFPKKKAQSERTWGAHRSSPNIEKPKYKDQNSVHSLSFTSIQNLFFFRYKNCVLVPFIQKHMKENEVKGTKSTLKRDRTEQD